jgi:hypothetical protein
MTAPRTIQISEKMFTRIEQIRRSRKISREAALEEILNAAEFGVHPLYKTLAEAPVDDEELTEIEIQKLKIAREEVARGEVVNFNDAIAQILSSRKTRE